MAEAFINVTEGSGKKLHAFDRTIGANTVLDEVILNGEAYLATYSMPTGAGVSIATANDHIWTINAGASLNVYVRRIEVYQAALATTAAIASFALFTTSTAAPTGGTVLTARTLDSTDAGSGATGMSLPTVKATEVGRMWINSYTVMQTAPTAGGSTRMFEIDFEKLRGKSLRIAAGTTNGLALKNLVATAACTVFVNCIFSEANF